MVKWQFGHRVVFLSVCAFLLFSFTDGRAQWTDDTSVNTRLTDSTQDEEFAVSVSDGLGGTITCYSTAAASGIVDNIDFLVQRLDADGLPVWGPVGVTISSDNWYFVQYQLIGDGAGGVFVVFTQNVGDVPHTVWAQRLSSNGELLWGVGGVDLCLYDSTQINPQCVADGNGGIIVGWKDIDGGLVGVFAQRVDGGGNRLWNDNGNPASNVSENVEGLSTAPASGPGQGAMFIWSAGPPSLDQIIKGQILDLNGNGMLSPEDMEISFTPDSYGLPALAPDMAGGYYAIWQLYDLTAKRIQSQHVQASGAKSFPSPLPVRGRYEDQDLYQIVADGSGGAFVLCRDDGPSAEGSRLMVQHLKSESGPAWGSYGIQITELSEGNIGSLHLSKDGTGGMYAGWASGEAGPHMAQHISGNGILQWPEDRPSFTSGRVRQFSGLISDGNGHLAVLWRGERNPWNPTYIFAHRLDQNGYPIDSAFTALSAVDRPNDQGGEVVLTWESCPLDSPDHQTVVDYSYWVRPVAKAGAEAVDRRGNPILPDAEVATLLNIEIPQVIELRDSGWTYGGMVPAVFSDDYSVFCPTYGDSTDVGITYSEFKVLAHHSLPAVFWEAENVLSGYSVDNLSPGAPLNLAGLNNAGAVDLTWNASGVNDEDLREYRIYRGDASGFPVDEDHLLAATAELFLQDLTASGDVWYRATAVDAHGNEGSASNEVAVSLGVSAVGAVPDAFRHNGNYPNPFNPATHIAFDLPSEAPVVLTIFSVDGRHITTLVNGTMSAGNHRVLWNGQDSSGRAVASGVYYSRLETDRETAVGKMTLAR